MTVKPAIEPCSFVRAVQPVLEKRDLNALLELLKSNWTAEQIVSLLSCNDCDARKVAALSLSLVGCQHCLPALAERLKEPDPIVNQMAEHAIWAIWFRGGSPEANHQLFRGAQALGRRDFDHAISHFDRAIQVAPAFAEPYNQRSIANFLLERYDAALPDCRRATELMPIHFGAWAGMGHCHAHLNRLDDALRCYERAIEINPHMSEIQIAVKELQSRVRQRTG